MSDSMDKLAKGIRNAIDEKNDRKPKAYDTQAEVLSKDGDILWVHIPGGVDRTPVRRTVDANEGDSVMVRVADGRAWTLGNATNPPTDDSYARRGLRDLRNATQGAVDFVGELSDQDVTVNSIRTATGYIDDLYSKNIHTDNIWAATGYIDDLTAKNITTDNISAATGYIDDLTSKHITAEDIEADHATVGSLEATYAKISDLTAANAKIDNLEANEAVINDTLKATNAEVEYLSSDWISTDRLVLTGNNKNNYPPVQITEVEFNVNKTAYWTKDGNNYIQCTEQSVYDEDTQYYVRQSVKAIIEAINNANRFTEASPTQAEFNADKTNYYTYDGAEYIQCKSTDTYNPNTQYYIYDTEILVSKDKLIAASMDVAELSAITADMGTLTAGKIQKGNNFINLNTVPASMEFKNGSTWDAATQGLKWDTQGNLNIKGTIQVSSGSNVPTITEMNSAIDGIEVGGRNLLIERNGSPSGASYSNHTITNTAADTKTRMQLMIQAYNGSTYEGAVLGGQAVSSTGKYVKTFNSERAVSAGRTLFVKHNGSTKDIGYNFTLSEGIASGEQLTISFTVQSNNPSTVGGLVIKDIKLERGNKSTDWTPAPEDVKSVHTIRATGADASYTYAQLLDYSSRTTILNWYVESTIGVKAGDTVRVGIAVSNMGTADNRPLAYVLVEVSSVDAANNRIYGYSKGLDTTIIDGGNIITNSIGANQINTNSIDIGSFGGSIGGRNLVTHSLNLSDFLEESRANCKITVYPESASITHVANSTSRLGVFYDILSPEVGAKYTLSFVASTATGDYSVGGSGTSSVWAGIVTYTAIKAGKNTVTFTVPSNATSLRIYFSVNSYNATATVSNVQLEKGSVVTDWKPSPYDIEPKQRIKADKIKLESSTYVSYSVSGDSITMNRISTSGGNFGMFYDFPCEPNSYYMVSAKVTARTGTSWGIYFGYRDSEYAQGSVWTGLGRVDNSAGVGGYYISRNSTATASTQTHIRVYFCSTVSGDSWTIEDITFQKGGDLATSSSYITHIDNSGIRIHPTSTQNNSAVINANGMTIYKGGTADANIVARYGDTAQIGPTGKGRVEIASSGIDMYGYSSSSENLCHIGYASGTGESGTAVKPYFTFGTRTGTIGNYSVVEGVSCEASGYASHAEGNGAKATAGGAHAEGNKVTISGTTYVTTASASAAHAEGMGTTASGASAHSEGTHTTANKNASHAEGSGTTASGIYAHAEGNTTTASNEAAHAEGYGTTASGTYSHAGGLNTIAAGDYQTAIGKYNVSDTSSLFIVGNGTASTRSNALKVDRSGNLTIAGTLNGFGIGAVSGAWYTKIPTVASDGVLEIGKYIDFHDGGTITSDYSVRLNASGSTLNITGAIAPSGIITAGSNIRLNNNTSLQGANTSGTYKSLIYISPSNTVNLGNSDCATYVNGTSFSGSKSYTGSDLRLKHDIVPLDNRSSELIMRLKPFEYKWNEGQEHFYSKGKCFGLGAQEVSKLMEDIGYNPKDYRVVEETPDGYLAICYTELIPHLIYVAQEQHKEIELLKAELKSIKEVC